MQLIVYQLYLNKAILKYRENLRNETIITLLLAEGLLCHFGAGGKWLGTYMGIM